MSDAMLRNLMDELMTAVDRVPPGRWGVGVSGGADSVALLMLLCQHRAADLHVIHMDHETRDGESGGDARFVAGLAHRLGLRSTIECRSRIEEGDVPANISARFRRARFTLFRQVARREQLNGVILAHHAGDQAETVLQRILRGGVPSSVSGMKPCAMVEGLVVRRPLLNVAPERLREFLHDWHQIWREDTSNQSDKYLRNRLRRWLSDRSDLSDVLLKIGDQSAMLRDWLNEKAPKLGERFGVEELAGLAAPLARHAAGEWLAARGAPSRELNRQHCEWLIDMAADAASPARRHFPGNMQVRRHRGQIFRDI